MQDLRRTRLRNGARNWHMEEVAAADNQTEMSEVVVFPSWQQYARSFSRATKWDLMQEGLAREYFVSSDPVTIAPAEPRWIFPPIPFLSGDGQRTFLASATSVQNGQAARKTGLWLRDRIANGFDRAIDEVFVVYDRIAAPRKRKASSRHLTFHVPTLLPHDDGHSALIAFA